MITDGDKRFYLCRLKLMEKIDGLVNRALQKILGWDSFIDHYRAIYAPTRLSKILRDDVRYLSRAENSQFFSINITTHALIIAPRELVDARDLQFIYLVALRFSEKI